MKERTTGSSDTAGSPLAAYRSHVSVGGLLGALVALVLVERPYVEAMIALVALLAGWLLLRRSRRRTRAWRAQLEQSEERWRRLVDEHPEPIYITLDTRFQYINASGARVFGAKRPEELLGRSVMEFAHPTIRPQMEARKAQLERGEPTGPLEHRMIRLDGTECMVVAQSVPVTFMGKPAVQTVIRDVTEQRQAEEALRQSKMLLEKTQRITRTGGWHLDADTRALSWTEETCRIHEVPAGYTPTVEEAIGFYAPTSRPRIRRAIERALKDGQGFDLELELDTAAGRRIWARSRGEVEIEDGRIVALTGTIRDVTRRKERERELVAAKEKAEEVSRLKSAFLANMSHEIRTPLTSIIGFADVLSSHVDGKPLKLLEMIRTSGRRLERTLMSVLDLAQLESETMKLRPERIDLVREAREAVGLFQAQVKHKGLGLRVDVPEAPIEMVVDRGALQRILSNLLSNAVKFTDEGHVCVRVRAEEPEAAILVEDTGIGIEEDQLDAIFREFRQASQGYTRDYEGSGLGLTITRELVALLGGTIAVESTKGIGSVFTVRLPLRPVGRADASPSCDGVQDVHHDGGPGEG